MATDLDLDDVAAQSPRAMAELHELRNESAALRDRVTLQNLALMAVAQIDIEGALCPAAGHAESLDKALQGVHAVLGAG